MAKCKTVSVGLVGAQGTKVAWDAVRALRKGLLGVERRAAPVRMQKEDGTLAASAVESAEVMRLHFEKLYSRTPVFDASVLELVPQLLRL